jgi:uncharacterized repeat protein (TIGR01451 family)
VGGVQPAPNPPFPVACGLDVAMVIDTSASITDPAQGGAPGNPAVIRTATNHFVDALTGTPSSVGVFSFRTAARTEVAITDVRTSAGAVAVKAAIDGIDFSTNQPAFFPAGTPYPAPPPAQASLADRYGTIGGTNWEDGFSVVSGKDADVVVFITDGNPTTWSGDVTQTPPDPGFVPGEQEDLDAGIAAANAIKAEGSRVIAVGIGGMGDLASFNPDNLKLISGPSIDDDYYLIDDFTLLAQTLDRISVRLCEAAISVVKYIDTPEGPLTASGWEFAVALDPAPDDPPPPQVTDSGGAASFAWNVLGDTRVILTETPQPGYRFVGASCTDRAGTARPVTQTGNGVELTIGVDDKLTCEFHNEVLPPGISLVKTPSTTVARVGDTVTYTYTITNTGPVVLDGITLSDDKLGPITPAATTLAPGASTTGTATTTVTAGALPGPLVNLATVTGTAPDQTTVTATDDATVGLAAITIVKQADPATATIGDTVTYTFTVTNTGGVSLTGLVLNDDKLGPITLAATTLAPGASTTGTATTTVTAGALPGPLVNLATVTGTAPDQTTVTATDDATVGLGALTVVKKADQGIATVGQTVTYTYTVTNTGSVALSGITVTDDKLGPITLAATTLAPGASTTGTATKTVTAADPAGGPVVNVATATGTTPDGKTVTGKDDEKVDLAAIAITKVPNVTSASVGDTITYTYTITNTGTVPLSTLGLTDDRLGALTPAATTLAPGASTTATATHLVTAADGAGPILNVATVTAATGPDPVTGQPDQVTATATATVAVVTVLPHHGHLHHRGDPARHR